MFDRVVMLFVMLAFGTVRLFVRGVFFVVRLFMVRCIVLCRIERLAVACFLMVFRSVG